MSPGYDAASTTSSQQHRSIHAHALRNQEPSPRRPSMDENRLPVIPSLASSPTCMHACMHDMAGSQSTHSPIPMHPCASLQDTGRAAAKHRSTLHSAQSHRTLREICRIARLASCVRGARLPEKNETRQGPVGCTVESRTRRRPCHTQRSIRAEQRRPGYIQAGQTVRPMWDSYKWSLDSSLIGPTACTTTYERWWYLHLV